MNINHMRKILATILLLGTLVLPVWGQSPATQKEIIVAIDSEYAPYEFVDESGRVTGFTVELLQEIGRISGADIRIQPMTWPDAVAGLENGSVDIINMINTPERAEKYAFSESHSHISQAIFRSDKSEDDDIVSLDSLTGHTVALQKNDISFEKLADRDDFEKVIVHSKEEGFLLLNAGKADAFLASEQAGIAMIQKYQLKNVEIAAVGLFSQPFSFATRKENTELTSFLNENLHETKRSGAYDTLVNKWFLPLPTEEDWFNHHRLQILWGIGILAAVAAGFALWTIILRAVVEQRTKALVESQTRVELQASALNAAGNGILITDNTGIIIWANKSFCESCGYPPEELLGENPRLLKSGVHSEEFYTELWNTILAGDVWHGDVTNRRKDGTFYTDASTITPIMDANGQITHFVAIKQDISARIAMEHIYRETNQQLMDALAELRKTQDMLVRQERLAAVGQLAAGIAHDFNNILTSILGFAELIQMSPDTPASAQKRLKNITEGGERAAKLVRQILDFSRKTLRQPKQFDAANFVGDAIRFMDSTLPETIHISLDVTPGEYMVNADPDQLHQVLTNLMLNAKDAMPSGGTITVTLEHGTGCDCAICQEPLVGDWIRIKISDDGTGVAAEALPHIFEPFFTTKDIGDGTGLGLSQVAGIMEQNGGHISVKSALGQGTTFVVSLPPGNIPAPKSKEAGKKSRGEGELILVVEDEPTVLSVTAEMVRALGYRAETAKNGREAMQLFEQHHSDIRLILSDMVMPDMNGAQLFEKIKADHPGIQMIIMSGYPLLNYGADLLDHGLAHWIKKPVTFGQLSQMLSRFVAEEESASRWA